MTDSLPVPPASRLTAVNPVIRGFAPDPSIIRVGEWFYLAVSSFEWFPTIPIHRSRDLVTWEYAGHVQGAAPGDSLAGYPDSAAIWAPALSYDDGTLWVVYSIVESLQSDYFNLDTYVSRARIVDGLPDVWTKPARVSAHGFDPSLFHEGGRHWLLNLQNDHRPGGERFSGIVLVELDVDDRGMRTIGPTRLLLQRDNLVEGPKLLLKDDWYYLTLAEGGTGTNHGVLMARSRQLAGPYEVDSQPLMTTRDDLTWPLQKAGHGEFVQSANGEWFMAHLTSRPIKTAHGDQNPLGRETAIQAITWNGEGWPRLAMPGWHPATEVSVPAAAPADDPVARVPAPGPAVVGWPWSSLREYATGDWADVDDGTGAITLRGRQSIESLRKNSLIGQRLSERHCSVAVTVDAHPTSFSQAAGLVLWYNTSAYISLQMTWAEPEGEPQRGQQFTAGGRTVLVLTSRSIDGATQLATTTIDATVPWTLHADFDRGHAQFSAAPRGEELHPIGPRIDAAFLSDDFGPVLRFTGTFAAINAVDLIDEEFTAEFRDFRISTS